MRKKPAKAQKGAKVDKANLQPWEYTKGNKVYTDLSLLPTTNEYQPQVEKMKQWIEKRKDKAQSLSPDYEKVINNTLNNLETVQFADGKKIAPKTYGNKAIGQYNRDSHRITMHNEFENDDIIHELGHASKLAKWEPAVELIKKVRENDKLWKESQVRNKEYLGSEEEIYSRIWAIREKLQLKPEDQVTPKQIKKLKNSAYPDPIHEVLSTESITELLNKLVSNDKPIKDNRGQWAHPGKVTEIASNNITMQGVDYPVLGVSDSGDTKMMLPGQDYKFQGNKVTEYPMVRKKNHAKEANYGASLRKKRPTYQNGGFSMDQINPEGEVQLQNIPLQNNMFDVTGIGYPQGGPPVEKPGIGNIISQGLPIVDGIFKGVSMIKQNKQQRREAERAKRMSEVVKQAAFLPPDKVKRKYVRPEDQVIDPNELAPTYGVGTNYLELGGTIRKKPRSAQYGDEIGSILNNARQYVNPAALGSYANNGTGEMSGQSVIGQTLGSAAGNLILPGIGGQIGGMIGSFAGGLIGAKGQKELKRDQKATQNNLQQAAFGQGSKALHNQYTGFMKNGGVSYLERGGDLQTQWGGKAEPISYNPYLPDNGETVMFKGNSHEEGGIGMKFGGSKVEVEGGEPAVKFSQGDSDSLVVYGDMKIPSYGVAELNDPNAKGKKFKNYIADLSKQENKQNEVIQKGTDLVNNTSPISSYDKLTISSGKALMEGGNMKLKDIAQKKQTAANVQNAILQTADELNLDSSELAKGNVKSLRKKRSNAQDGEIIPRAKREEYERLYGYQYDQQNDWLFKDTNTEGVTKVVNSTPPGKGGEAFNKAFADARKKKLGEFEYRGKKYTTDIYKDSPKTIQTPGEARRNYVYLKDEPVIPPTNPVQPTQPVQEKDRFPWESIIGAALPYFRPSNQAPFDYNQVMGEMNAMSTNQLDPVQAQLYNPLLEQVSDISLQDQMNANQADFNSLKRLTANNPAAQAQLAAQKYQANSSVLGEQFRQNQGQKMGVFNRNRQTLNDAQLKNLGILDNQYVRQSQAKSNTKAVTHAAITSISDKIQKHKLENRTLGVYENLYNYRYDDKGRAWNWNAPVDFGGMIENASPGLLKIDENGKIVMNENKVRKDKNGIVTGSTDTKRVTDKQKNGGIVKYSKY